MAIWKSTGPRARFNLRESRSRASLLRRVHGVVESARAAGLGVEQALRKDIAVFGRVGFSDGKVEDLSFTDADRTLTAGVVIKGLSWGCPDDTVGLAAGVNGLTAAHRKYLAAGGVSLQLGDGRLKYGLEQFFEAFYAFRAPGTEAVTVTADAQLLRNPGYNRRRGPIGVFGLRLHYEFGLAPR